MDIDKSKVVTGWSSVNGSYALFYGYGNYLLASRTTGKKESKFTGRPGRGRA